MRNRVASKSRRAFAILTLVCALWFGTASNFMHTCNHEPQQHGKVVHSVELDCLSCIWGSVGKTAALPIEPGFTAILTSDADYHLLSAPTEARGNYQPGPRAPPV